MIPITLHYSFSTHLFHRTTKVQHTVGKQWTPSESDSQQMRLNGQQPTHKQCVSLESHTNQCRWSSPVLKASQTWVLMQSKMCQRQKGTQEAMGSPWRHLSSATFTRKVGGKLRIKNIPTLRSQLFPVHGYIEFSKGICCMKEQINSCIHMKTLRNTLK